MSRYISRIISMVRREEHRKVILDNYENKGRRIEHWLYQKLKKAKVCEICGKQFQNIRGKRNTIDHHLPIQYGGTNEEKNLRPAHEDCHHKADMEKDKIVQEHGIEKLRELVELKKI